MTRLAGSAPRSKYGSRAVCACGHARDLHNLKTQEPPTFCLDAFCGCEQYHKAYDSQAEAARGAELALLERAGKIRCLQRQLRYRLEVNEQHVTDYVADFAYIDCQTGRLVVEDVKGHRTREYLMKRRLMQAVLGIEIQEYEA